MSNVKINGSKISLEVHANIKSKRQKLVLKQMLKEEISQSTVMNYLQSFNKKLPNLKEARGNLAWMKQQSLVGGPDNLQTKGIGSVLKKFNRLINTTANHSPSLNPSTLGDWIGVEIECFIPYETMTERFSGMKNENGRDIIFFDNTELCECSNSDCELNHNEDNLNEPRYSAFQDGLSQYFKRLKLKRVSIKDDGSINTPDHLKYMSAEITIVFNRHDREPLKQLCSALNDLDTRVNKSCGLHVHLDMRDTLKRNIDAKLGQRLFSKRARRLGACVKLFGQMVPKSRRDNNYCRLGSSRKTGDRYYAINLTAMEKYQTIEVRLHSGTAQFDKISNWIDLLLLVSRNEKPLVGIDSLEKLLERCPVPDYLIDYIEKRIKLFLDDSVESEAA